MRITRQLLGALNRFKSLSLCLALIGMALPSAIWAQTKIHTLTDDLVYLSQPESSQSLSRDFEGTFGVVEKKSATDKPVIVTQARVATHPQFDRIVLTLAGEELPGYRVAYTTQRVEECGSGETVRELSSTRILVRLSPSQAHQEDGKITIQRTARYSYQSLRQFRVICDYEGDVEIVLGMAGRAPYRVTELTNPLRLVIDVRHLPRK